MMSHLLRTAAFTALIYAGFGLISPFACALFAVAFLAAAEAMDRRELNRDAMAAVTEQALELGRVKQRLDAEVAGVPKADLVKTVNAMAADVLKAKAYVEGQVQKAAAQTAFGVRRP